MDSRIPLSHAHTWIQVFYRQQVSSSPNHCCPLNRDLISSIIFFEGFFLTPIRICWQYVCTFSTHIFFHKTIELLTIHKHFLAFRQYLESPHNQDFVKLVDLRFIFRNRRPPPSFCDIDKR